VCVCVCVALTRGAVFAVAIVFDTEHKGTHFKTDAELKAFMDDCVNHLVAAGLTVTLFYSMQEDEVYCKVGADDRRLLEAADEHDHYLKLDEHAMKIVAESTKDEALGRKPIHLEKPFDESQQFKTKLNVLGLEPLSIPGLETEEKWHKLHDDFLQRHINSLTRLSPWEQLYAPYNDDWEKHHKDVNHVQIYQQYPATGGSILRSADRLKLIQIIIESSTLPNPKTGSKGAGINLSEIVVKKKALAAFPLHSASAVAKSGELSLDELRELWGKILKVPWHQPYDQIRDYFGEKIALYFAFLGHYTMWLFAAAFVGVPLFLHQMAEIDINDPGGSLFAPSSVLQDANGNWYVQVWTDVPEVGIFAIFISLWGTFMLEFWKRKQARLALRWGTSSFEAMEVTRPEFNATHFVPDPVTGHAVPYYSTRTLLVKAAVALVCVFACLCIVISYIASIYTFKTWVVLPENVTNFGISETTATTLALILNAVLIQIVGTAYKTVAKKLNDWQNFRTDTAYEDALITKVFMFTFTNSYATLFYIAFIKTYLPILGQRIYCDVQANPDAVINPKLRGILNVSASTPAEDLPPVQDACFGALGSSLLIIFLTQLILGNTLEVVIPAITAYFKRRSNLKPIKPKEKQIGNDAEAAKPAADEYKLKSPVEEQFFLKQYDGTFDDFLEIVLQFGYVTLFVAAFPLAPLLAFLNDVVEIRVDSFKLCKLCRRPLNTGAQDIGTWQHIYYLMGLINVATNAGIVFFTSNIIKAPDEVPASYQGAWRVWMFLLSIALLLFFKWLADFALPDVPEEVEIQLQRQDYLVRKCFGLERDDEEMLADAKKNDHPDKVAYEICKVDPDIEGLVVECAQEVFANSSFDIEGEFKKADKDHDGNISLHEFTKLLKKAGGTSSKLSESEIALVAQCLDGNNNGQLELEEFRKFVERAKPKQNVKKAGAKS